MYEGIVTESSPSSNSICFIYIKGGAIQVYAHILKQYKYDNISPAH